MTVEQGLNEDAIFEIARNIASPEPRESYLQQVCSGDRELGERVRALLKSYEENASFLEAPPSGLCDSPTLEHSLVGQTGTQIGPYKLLQQIGEGGMGVVHMAEQAAPVRRKVALKIIKPGMDTREVIARFEAERQALALMDHVNIARVLDAGATEHGRPYFVMELVHGVPITKYCDDNRLTPRQRLELFVPVCQAIQHAHQKGIIHRDIKPSNVMITLYDGKPVPKVIDFGVAKATEQKLTERTLFTQYGALVGTLEYMAPEQAEMSALGADTRSDIYSLGVLLYELLTGSTPLSRKRIREAAYGEVLRMIKEEEPPKPSTRLSDSGEALASISAQRQTEPAKLSKLVRGELDWIVMKTLEKDRNRRYETANGFAADVQRYLDNEAVHACPPSVRYRFRKFVRRNRLAMTTAAVISAALVLAVAVSTWQAFRATAAERLARSRLIAETEAKLSANEARIEESRQRRAAEKSRRNEAEQRALADARRIDADQQRTEAERQRDHAHESELLARRRLYAAHINLAHQAREAGNSARALELLEGQRPKFDQEDLRTFEWYYLWRLCHASHRLTLAGHTGGVTSVAYSPDGKMLASASIDTTVKVWDTATGQPLATLQGQLATVWCVAFSPDGKTLASAGGNSFPTAVEGRLDQCLRLWDVETWKEKAVFKGDWGAIRSLEFSPDGKTLAAGTYVQKADQVEGLVKLWDLATGEVKATLRGHEQAVMSVAFSPDSQKLASSSAWTNPRVKLWDLTAEPPGVLHEWEGAWSVAFAPDGQTLAKTMPAGSDGKVKLRDVATGAEIGVYQPRAADITSVVYAPDGKTLAMCCADRTVRLWEPGAGRHWTLSHLQSVTDVVFSPDGRAVASASQDRTVKVWSVDQDQDEPTLHGYRGWKSSIAYSPDGNTFAYAATGDVIRLCDPATGQERSQLSGQGPHLIGMTFSRDSKRMVAGGGIAPTKVWDVATTRELANFDATPRGVHSLALSPDGKTLACAGEDSDVQLFDLDTHRLRKSFRPAPGWPVGVAAYSPDGKWLATADLRGWVDFWNAATMLRGLRIRVTLAGFTWALAFSPDGETFVTAGDGGIMKRWDAATGKLLATFRGHTARINAVAFFPDGETVASGSDDGTVKLWDVPTGQERLTLLGHSDHVISVAVAPDGKTLATGSRDGTVKLWRASDDRDAAAINRELDADDPATPVAQIHLANALLRIRRTGEAEEAFRLAISRLEALQAAIPPAAHEYSQLHAESQHQLARLLIAGKRVQEAEPILVEAIGAYERIVAASPEYHVAANNLGLCYVRLAQLLAGRDRPQEAATAYRKALALTPDNATAINNLAWMLATTPDTKLRDPGKAVELAERAVALAPTQATSWNTLGVARYRAGDWQSSIDALKKAEELLAEKNFSFNAFFVAMAEWQLDHKEEAGKWFAESDAWMQKNQPENEELQRFRAEATELLGVKDKETSAGAFENESIRK